MVANIIIGLVILVLFVLAVRYALKNRDCGGNCGKCSCGCGGHTSEKKTESSEENRQ